MAAARDRTVSVRVQGLAKLNRDLGSISAEMRTGSLAHMRGVAQRVRDDARPLTPVRTGRLRRSLRYQASSRGASVSSSLPYAGVVEWGGTIAPRGTPIKFERARMLGRAVVENTGRIEEEMGDLLDRAARLNGFH